MRECHVLSHFTGEIYDGINIDTTSGKGGFKDLSPFILPAPPAKNLENLWQFSKVYKCHIVDGEAMKEWYLWQQRGWADIKPHRYPMGKGAIPEYSLWRGERLGYIEARKRIYAPEYAKNVVETRSYRALKALYDSGEVVILRDYDAYDHIKMGMSLKDVINNPNRKMGHAFVLMMLLQSELEECLL